MLALDGTTSEDTHTYNMDVPNASITLIKSKIALLIINNDLRMMFMQKNSMNTLKFFSNCFSQWMQQQTWMEKCYSYTFLPKIIAIKDWMDKINIWQIQSSNGIRLQCSYFPHILLIDWCWCPIEMSMVPNAGVFHHLCGVTFWLFSIAYFRRYHFNSYYIFMWWIGR